MKGKAADCHLLLQTTAEIKASGDSVGCFFAISPKSHEYTASIISSMQMHSNLEFPSFFVQNIKKVFYFLYFYKSILLWTVHIQHRWKVPFVRADWLVREWIASNIATCEQSKGKKIAHQEFLTIWQCAQTRKILPALSQHPFPKFVMFGIWRNFRVPTICLALRQSAKLGHVRKIYYSCRRMQIYQNKLLSQNGSVETRDWIFQNPLNSGPSLV